MDQNRPPRQNTAMAAIVDDAIALDRKVGAANAWVYMTSANVPVPVVKRVLAAPSLRRSAEQPH